MGCGCNGSCRCGSRRSNGWAVESNSCDSHNGYYPTNSPLSVTSIRLGVEEEIKPFSTLEDFMASGYKKWYLTIANEEGAIENTMVFNPQGFK